MLKKTNKSNVFGLVGRNISYSFSRSYFTAKFKALGLNNINEYLNFDIDTIEKLKDELLKYDNIKGFNVTIPYKKDIFKYIDNIDPIAKEIGAINTVKIDENNNWNGYNTDIYGFEFSLKPLLKNNIKKALVLGTGGASKAVIYVLKKLNIDYLQVSRNPVDSTQISYEELDKEILKSHLLIINCTPLGTSPNTELKPNIPYLYLNKNHLLYDLIYNPEISSFLKEGIKVGSKTKNGQEMLELQAEKSWEIWNK
ncbi:MAG: shikimate dehydrogenase [Flavobacteriaceae bacterium]|nr:shikimate dehydrogenase [Flavobacteriaceae bacterium]